VGRIGAGEEGREAIVEKGRSICHRLRKNQIKSDQNTPIIRGQVPLWRRVEYRRAEITAQNQKRRYRSQISAQAKGKPGKTLRTGRVGDQTAQRNVAGKRVARTRATEGMREGMGTQLMQNRMVRRERDAERIAGDRSNGKVPSSSRPEGSK